MRPSLLKAYYSEIAFIKLMCIKSTDREERGFLTFGSSAYSRDCHCACEELIKIQTEIEKETLRDGLHLL